MSFTPKTDWEDLPSTNTPISAAELTRIETALGEAYDLEQEYEIAPGLTVTLKDMVVLGETLLDETPVPEDLQGMPSNYVGAMALMGLRETMEVYAANGGILNPHYNTGNPTDMVLQWEQGSGYSRSSIGSTQVTADGRTQTLTEWIEELLP